MSSYISQCYRWANRQGSTVGENARRVLIELMTYADLNTGGCNPKRATLARNIYATDKPTKSQTNMISTALGELRDAGLIGFEQGRRANGSNSSNNYVINLPEPNATGRGAEAVPNVTGHGRPNGTGHGTPNVTGHGVPNGTGLPEVSTERIQKKVSTRSTSEEDQAPSVETQVKQEDAVVANKKKQKKSVETKTVDLVEIFGDALDGLDLARVWSKVDTDLSFGQWKQSEDAVADIRRSLLRAVV